MTPPSETELKRNELLKKIHSLRRDMEEIYQRIDGLGYTPKEHREEKFEKLKAELVAKQSEEDTVRKELQSLPD